MNYMENIDYRQNDFYKKQYNGLIEHFDSGIHEGFLNGSSMCSGTGTPTQAEVDSAAKTFGLVNQNGSYSGGTSGNANGMLTSVTGQQTSLLAHVTGMTDDVFNRAFCILTNAAGNSTFNPLVPTSILGNSGTNITSTAEITEPGLTALQKYRDIQRSQPSKNFGVEADVIGDVVNRLIEDQDLVWQASNSQDSDFKEKLRQFLIEQASLKIGNDKNSVFNEQVSKYRSNTNFQDNNLRLDARNKYITDFQQHALQQVSGKEKMLTADIETRERYIQINRYEYYRKRDRVSYCKLIIVITGIAAICYGVGGTMADDKKKIFNIATVVLYVLGVIILWLKINRDNIRYNLDWDEINFPVDDWYKGGKADNCVTRAMNSVGQSVNKAGQGAWNAAQTTGQAVAT